MPQAVKRSLDREMDLEGIDMSNIVNGGRRGRREAAAQPVNYKCAITVAFAFALRLLPLLLPLQEHFL